MHKNSERQNQIFQSFRTEGRRERQEREIERGHQCIRIRDIYSNTEAIGQSSASSILKGLM